MLNFDTVRTLSVSGPALPTLPDGSPALLLAAISGEEALSTLFRYDLFLTTPLDMPEAEAAAIDLKALIGTELTVTIQLDGMGEFVAGATGLTGAANIGAGTREISGIVTEAGFVEQMNRQSRYRVLLQPWTALMDLRSDYRIFQRKTVVEILEAVFGSRRLRHVKQMNQNLSREQRRIRYAIAVWSIVILTACSRIATPSSSIKSSSGTFAMNSNQSSGSANQTGIPDNRINWIKNPLVTKISFMDGTLRSDSLKVRFNASFINPTREDLRRTAMPMPDDPLIRLYCEGRRINPIPERQDNGVLATKAAPRDDEVRKYRYVLKGQSKWTSDVPGEFVIANTQFLPGTHTYEMVYWQSQLDWIDVREVLDRTDALGKGRMRYPITDNAPSNRLYFKVYKPTEEEAAKGRKIEYLGEVDARTQVPAFPYARPGDFSPRTGYWQAVGPTIDIIGGYHEAFVKEGDQMPNLPGDIGVDPFSFEWKYAGEQPKASAR